MSEFVKQIVEGVMNRNATDGSATIKTRIAASSNTAPSSPPQQVDVANIPRPNYQRDKKSQRLKPLSQTNAPAQASRERTAKNRRQHNVFSQLKQLSLVQGKGFNSDNSPVTASPFNDRESSAKLIGKTRAGSCVWFFPTVRARLKSLFNVSTNRGGVGVITANECYPGQLFLIEEMLKQLPMIEYHLEWENRQDHPFVCELFSEDSDQLEKLLKNLYQTLNRQQLNPMNTHIVTSPSAWLSRRLELSQSVQAIGVVEGVSYYHGLQMIDYCLTKQPDVALQFKVKPHYTLLVGDRDIVTEALHLFKQSYDRTFRY